MENLAYFCYKYFLIIVLLLLLNGSIRKCKCDSWEYKLVHDILSGYDSSIRPSLHHNLTLNVTFGLALAQLIDVDERNMIVTTNCWLNQGWLDPKLTWNPSLYDGIKAVHIPVDKLWKPDIILINNADSLARSSSISTNAMVKYNGNVTWLSTVIFKSSCSINVRYFPFDEQSCDMIFASWTFNGFLLDLNVNSQEGDITNYMKNGEWHLVKLLVNRKITTYSCCEEPYPEIHYKLIIRRRPLFYVFNMVFPCLLITLVAFLGFYLPPGSGEKVNIGITTLLSITVFLMLVAESMPPTSEQLPLLGIYYAITIGIVSLSTAMTVVTLNINNKGYRGEEVPRRIKIVFFDYIATIFRIKIDSKKLQKERLLHSKLKIRNMNKINEDIPLKSENNLSNHVTNDHNYINANNKSTYNSNNEKIKQHASLQKQMSNHINTVKLNTDNSNSENYHHNFNESDYLNANYTISNNGNKSMKPLSSLANGENLLVRSSSFNTNPLLINANGGIGNTYGDYGVKTNNSNNSNNIANNGAIKEYLSLYSQKLNDDDNNRTQNMNYQASKKNLSNNIACIGSCNNTQTIAQTPIILPQTMSKTNNTNILSAPYSTIIQTTSNSRCIFCDNTQNNNFQQQHQTHSRNSPPNKLKKPMLNLNNDENIQSLYLTASQNHDQDCIKGELDTMIEQHFGEVIRSIKNTIHKGDLRRLDEERRQIIQNEWSDVAMILDRLLCYFFSISTLVTCALIFLNSPHSLSQW